VSYNYSRGIVRRCLDAFRPNIIHSRLEGRASIRVSVQLVDEHRNESSMDQCLNRNKGAHRSTVPTPTPPPPPNTI
jgi:hypothetical protein